MESTDFALTVRPCIECTLPVDQRPLFFFRTLGLETQLARTGTRAQWTTAKHTQTHATYRASHTTSSPKGVGPSTPWPALMSNNDKASARAPLHESMDPYRKSQAWRTCCCKRGGSWRVLALDNCRTTSLPLRKQARQDEPDHAHLPTQGTDVVSGAELPTKQHH